ncbi:hypothetical protein [Nonomuraea sp. KM88]|uniref:hypothetical protein n=1 Tax=Nonomuraea sp. KM88 TaxID=3457427 RepID=UPI003FCED456
MRDHRRALIDGLLNLAIFLETHPDVPTSSGLTLRHIPERASDEDLRAEIDRIAAILGSRVDAGNSPYDHYATSIHFGPVEYRAVAIPAAARALYDAESSYRGCIEPNA